MTNILLITSLISLLSNSLTIVRFSAFDFIFIAFPPTQFHSFYFNLDDVECEVGFDSLAAGGVLN